MGDLPTTKIGLNAGLDTIAERARRKHITVGEGQTMVYLDKANEAADYKAAGYPAGSGSPPILVNYPFIQAEVNATGKTNQDAADDILTERSNWISIASSIEEARLSGKKAINEALTIEDAGAAHFTSVTALNVILGGSPLALVGSPGMGN